MKYDSRTETFPEVLKDYHQITVPRRLTYPGDILAHNTTRALRPSDPDEEVTLDLRYHNSRQTAVGILAGLLWRDGNYARSAGLVFFHERLFPEATDGFLGLSFVLGGPRSERPIRVPLAMFERHIRTLAEAPDDLLDEYDGTPDHIIAALHGWLSELLTSAEWEQP